MRKFNWIGNDEYLYLTILGVPLGAPEALKPYWTRLEASAQNRRNSRQASSGSGYELHDHIRESNVGEFHDIRRAKLATPKWFHTRVQKAADAVLWTSPYTNQQRKWKWIKHPGQSAGGTLCETTAGVEDG
eukprot:scaffold97997_cov34-Tisochrysis_lutea.AAC.1